MNETKIFETLFDVLPFGVYVADVDTLNIVYVNEHFKRGTENLSDDSCYKIIYGNDRPCIFCKINELITSDRQPNGKTIIFDNFNELDDKWYRVEERSIYWPNGKLVKYSICVDISELKSVQNQLSESHADLLIKNKKIEEAKEKLNLLYNELKISKERELKAEKLRVLLNLVGNIAHHLNNLNTPIAYITEKLLTSGLYPEIKRELEIIKNSVNKSSQIIQSMIQYCQKAIILKKTFDIVRFIEDYLAEKKQYYEGQYEFIFNKSDNREIYIDFDMQMLRQCFDNIVKNSIEAMSIGGKIEFHLDSFYKEGERFIKLSIKDEGEGIEEDEILKVMEPFYTTRKDRNATGLGLSEVSGILNQHGGFIDINSEKGKGTEVSLYILPK